MGIGASISLIAAGLVMALAIGDPTWFGVDVRVVGWILVVCGVLGLVITMMIFAPRRRAQVPPPQQTYYRDDRGAF